MAEPRNRRFSGGEIFYALEIDDEISASLMNYYIEYKRCRKLILVFANNEI